MNAATTRTGGFTIGFRRAGSDWQKDPAALSRWATENGFGCIDLGADALDAAPAVQQAGLAVGSADMLDGGHLMNADAARRREAVEKNRDWIQCCAAQGIDRFFICLLPADPGRARRENFADMLASIADLAPVFESSGSALAIEGYPGRGALCCNPSELRALFGEVGSEAIGINFDPSHLIRMGIDALRFLREFAPRVRHVHAKDTIIDTEKLYEIGYEQPDTFNRPVGFGGAIWRYTLPGHGSFAWTRGFEMLQAAGYQGHVSIELEDCHFNGSEDGEKRGLILSRQYLQGA